MDARLFRAGLVILTVSTSTVSTSTGAIYRTPNFTVDAPTPEIASQVGRAAEMYRRELAIDWLGKALPRWSKPCPIKVKVGQIGAGGATSFAFDRGEVFGWRMNIQGSLERILDSVLPHEVSHTIFACHFRRPLPRWADEGAATLVEHESERRRQIKLLEEVLANGNRFPMRKLLCMKEYPSDMRKVLTLYAQGYSLAEFLIQQEGKSVYLQFLSDANDVGWDAAIARHYAHKNVEILEKRWSNWVIAGSPRLNLPKDSMVADAGSSQVNPEAVVVRGQTPDGLARNVIEDAVAPLASEHQLQHLRSASHLERPVLRTGRFQPESKSSHFGEALGAEELVPIQPLDDPRKTLTRF